MGQASSTRSNTTASISLHLWSLPDIAHDAIASYLTMIDTHCMMESSQWLLKAYGGRIKELTLVQDKSGRIRRAITIANPGLYLFRRRPELVHITVGVNEMMDVVARAMGEGYLDKLQELEVVDPSWRDIKSDHILALCDALADGTCPNINKLVVPSKLLPCLGDAMRGRMEQGCCGLRSLEIKGDDYPSTASSLVSVLSSGACETLEEFKLTGNNANVDRDMQQAVLDWLTETKAPHLRALILPRNSTKNEIEALCSPGIAPRLQLLELDTRDAVSLQLQSQAIGRGKWLHLRELKIRTWNVETQEMMPSLVEAIGVGARELTTLKLGGSGVGPEGGMAVARMLRDGGCPRLEELDLSKSSMGDDAVVELARALEGGAPCNITLRRLNLAWRDITSVGMRELMESIGRGALPHLECLDLSESYEIRDEGVMALAGAMSTGAIRYLQELRLENSNTSSDDAKALFQTFRDHKPCPHLKKLKMGHNLIGDDGVVLLAKAIEAGAIQHLQELDVLDVGMGDEGFKALVKAIVAQKPNPGCPRLEVLDVSRNRHIGNDGVKYLAKMVKMKGAMQHLQQLHLGAVSMMVEGARALFQALGEGHACPNLEELGLAEVFEEDESDLEFDYDGNIITTDATRVSREWQSVVESMDMRRRQHRHCSEVKIT